MRKFTSLDIYRCFVWNYNIRIFYLLDFRYVQNRAFDKRL